MFDFRIDDQCHEKQVLVNSELHCIFQTLVVSKKKDNMILFRGLKFGKWNQKNFKTLFGKDLLFLRNQEAHKCHNIPNQSTCQTTKNPVLKTAKLLQEHPKWPLKQPSWVFGQFTL